LLHSSVKNANFAAIDIQGEGEPVMQENNEESEVSLSVEEGNVGTIPAGISRSCRKILKEFLDLGSVIWNLLQMFFSIVSCPECNFQVFPWKKIVTNAKVVLLNSTSRAKTANECICFGHHNENKSF
jgi:hypothetical protein